MLTQPMGKPGRNYQPEPPMHPALREFLRGLGQLAGDAVLAEMGLMGESPVQQISPGIAVIQMKGHGCTGWSGASGR
jgi:hypothetical protein